MPKIVNGAPTDVDLTAPGTSEQVASRQAIMQIELKRRFRVNVAVSGLGMLILVVIWAIFGVPQRRRMAEPGLQSELRDP